MSKTRGQVLSIYGMTGLIAGVAGQLLLPATDPAGLRPFCVVAITTSTKAPSSADGDVKIDPRALYQQSPFGVVAAFLSGATTGAFFALGPVFAQGRELDNSEIVLFMSSGTLGGFAMALPLGWLSDRMDRRLLIIAAAVTAAAILLPMVATVPHGAYPWGDVVAKDELVTASGGLLLL